MIAALSWPIVERIPLVGGAAISPHGIGIAVGFVLAAYVFRWRGRDRPLRHDGGEVDLADFSSDIVVRAVIGAIIASRLAYVLTHADEFLTSVEGLVRVFALTDGGFSFLGGLTGALLLVVPWLRREGYDGVRVLDVGAAPVAVGLICGRIGDLVIGDHIGVPTSSPLGWRCTANLYDEAANSLARIPPEAYPSGRTPLQGCYDVALHQTALYDGAAAIVVLLVVLFVDRVRRRPGVVAATWILAYAPLRILGDIVREDRRWYGLTGSQWAMLTAFVAVTAWLLRVRDGEVSGGDDEGDASDPEADESAVVPEG